MAHMLELLKPFILTFIPIFVAVDAIGNIPLFIALVEGANKKKRQAIIIQSVTTATVVAFLFLIIGKWCLRLIGITIPDFQIAGGILLFVIATRLLLPGDAHSPFSSSRDKDVGVFPLGTPLITGPAVLTTTLMMLDSFPWLYTGVSLILNMLFVWVTLANADGIMGLLGSNGTRAFSKIMFILLAAIGIMMIRRGVQGAFVI